MDTRASVVCIGAFEGLCHDLVHKYASTTGHSQIRSLFYLQQRRKTDSLVTRDSVIGMSPADVRLFAPKVCGGDFIANNQ